MIYIFSIIIIIISFIIVGNNPAINGLSTQGLYREAGKLAGSSTFLLLLAFIIIRSIEKEFKKKLDKSYMILIMALCFFLAVILNR